MTPMFFHSTHVGFTMVLEMAPQVLNGLSSISTYLKKISKIWNMPYQSISIHINPYQILTYINPYSPIILIILAHSFEPRINSKASMSSLSPSRSQALRREPWPLRPQRLRTWTRHVQRVPGMTRPRSSRSSRYRCQWDAQWDSDFFGAV